MDFRLSVCEWLISYEGGCWVFFVIEDWIGKWEVIFLVFGRIVTLLL